MRAKGHAMNVRRIPANPGLPAQRYIALCQCGWTCEDKLRVSVDEQRQQHVLRALQPKYKGYRCPCGTNFNTRKDRETHMGFCMQAPDWWAA